MSKRAQARTPSVADAKPGAASAGKRVVKLSSRQQSAGWGSRPADSTARAPRLDPPSNTPLVRLAFSHDSLPGLRRLVAAGARRARMTRARCQDLVLAADELATNSVMHGGGSGELRLWCTEEGVLCEVRDRGHIRDPLIGRRPPRPEQHDGRGLWVVGKLADYVEICSSPGRTTVRVLMLR